MLLTEEDLRITEFEYYPIRYFIKDAIVRSIWLSIMYSIDDSIWISIIGSIRDSVKLSIRRRLENVTN